MSKVLVVRNTILFYYGISWLPCQFKTHMGDQSSSPYVVEFGTWQTTEMYLEEKTLYFTETDCLWCLETKINQVLCYLLCTIDQRKLNAHCNTLMLTNVSFKTYITPVDAK